MVTTSQPAGATTSSKSLVLFLADSTDFTQVFNASGERESSFSNHCYLRVAQFSLDSHYLALGDQQGQIFILEAPSCKLLRKVTVGSPVISLRFDPRDASRLLVGMSSGIIAMVDVVAGRVTAEHPVHGNWIRSMIFSADLTRILIAADDHFVRIVDATSFEPLTRFVIPDFNVWVARWAEQERKVAVSSGYSLKIFEVSDPTNVKTVDLGGDVSVFTQASSQPWDNLTDLRARAIRDAADRVATRDERVLADLLRLPEHVRVEVENAALLRPRQRTLSQKISPEIGRAFIESASKVSRRMVDKKCLVS
eukprot:TRINITY_DN1247_c0_g1_i4.p1 TRINITY_DN1247_c0_g1~~TRINITY_DN1247_c0_g1_i4.p1  ORF type:complete len:309 (-),score=47.46 TRINITY_DN1247_c0_g1_i4:7-933(-)